MDHHGEFEGMQSPDIELILPDDEVDLTTPPRAHKSFEENEEALHIKPPPPNAKRDKHKHKHKEDRKRDRERDKERSRHGDREKERSMKHRDRHEKERIDMYEKERDREHQRRKEVEELEAEAKRREKSQMERDRLERLERERRKLEREAEREQREREHREKMRQEQERLAKAEREQERLQKAEREQQRYAKAEREKERMIKSRSDRSHRRDDADNRKKTHSTRQDVEKRRDRDKDRRRERRGNERSRSRSPREGRDSKKRYKEHYDSHHRDDYKHMDFEEVVTQHDDRHDHQHDEHIDEDLHDPTDDLLDDIYEHQSKGTSQEPLEEASSESSSDSESEDSDTDSESESEESVQSHKPASHSEPESADENGHQEDIRSVKLYGSKFDDDLPASEVESVPESEPQEPPTDDEDYMEQTPPESPIELAPQLPVYLPAIQGCRNVEEFHCLNRIEEGTYGVVYRARDNKTDELVALKRLKMEKEKEGFPITSLREINTLLKSQHPNIVTVREIVVGSNMDKIYIVMDYVEHDLKSLMQSMKDPFITGEVKTLMQQLLRGVAHLHDNWIIHRDLKTSNLLLSHNGILKIGDFGLAREYGSPLKPYTSVVVTLWYRSPELLLGIKEYSTYIDMWSVGCIFAEFLTMKPLFPGKSEIDELNRIFKELGTPNEKIWPGVSQLPVMKKCTFAEYPYNQLRNRFSVMLTDTGFDLMNRFLAYDPARRVTAKEALLHQYFNESPMPVPPSMFPTWPAKSEQAARTHGNTPRPPSGGKAYDKLLGDDDEVLERGFRIGANHARGSAASSGFSLKF